MSREDVAALLDAWHAAFAVHFLRREPDGAWRVTLLMNSHSHPMETLA